MNDMDFLTLKDVDKLISFIRFPKTSDEFNLLKIIRSFYKRDEDLKAIKSIKTEKIIPIVWPPANTTPQSINSHIKNKRKDLSSLKSNINNQCRDLFWENKNPGRIGIGRYNTFQALKQTKYEESKKFKTEIEYLRTVLSEIAPEELIKIIGDSAQETQRKIVKALIEKKEQGKTLDEDVILKKDMELLVRDTEDLTKRLIDNSQMVAGARGQITRLLERLEELNKQASEFPRDTASEKTTEMDSNECLAEISEAKMNIDKLAEKVNQILDELKFKDDLALEGRAKKMAEALTELIKEKEAVDLKRLQRLFDEKMKTLEISAEAVQADVMDDTAVEKREDIEKELHSLKEKAQKINLELEQTYSQATHLIDKSKTLASVSEQERERLTEYQETLDELQRKEETHRALAETNSETAEEKSPEISDMVEIEKAFYIDKFPVTIDKFQKFVEKTGYKTYAERAGYAWVYYKAGWRDIDSGGIKKMIFQRSALSRKKGACWKHPEGIKKTTTDILATINHPVVQITFFDALEYAKWMGKRLPNQEEWLLAASGRSPDRYPWGNEPDIEKCNNRKSHFESLSPVDVFDPNRYGVYDIMGNVWEWCENDDPEHKMVLGGCWNMEIEEMGLSLKQQIKASACNNTVGFRCVKDKSL